MSISLDELNGYISEYILNNLCTCEDHSELTPYIHSWGLVTNIGYYQTPMSVEYRVDSYPEATPPHALKGLLGEGIDVVDMVRFNGARDEEDM